MSQHSPNIVKSGKERPRSAQRVDGTSEDEMTTVQKQNKTQSNNNETTLVSVSEKDGNTNGVLPPFALLLTH